MDFDESTVQTETAEAEETSSAFDEGWDELFRDSDTDDGQEADRDTGDAWETDEESEATEADADQQEADEPEGDGTDGNDSQGKAEGDEGSPDQGETYTLRHLGEERTVNRDEVISLAQQGMDYGRIKGKWDAVKDDVPKLRMYEGFLQELAETRGGNIDDLIDEVRTKSLIAQAKSRGETLTPTAAAAQAVRARLAAMAPAEAQKQADAEEEAQNRRKASVDRFFSIYGKTVKSEDIPIEVWQEADKSGDLVGVYQKHAIEKLEKENQRLQKELEQAKQQQKNRSRSVGSMRSVGSAATKDPFDEGWDDAW